MSTSMEEAAGRTCSICGENKGPWDTFIHDVCKDCHDYDHSDCEECHPRSIR